MHGIARNGTDAFSQTVTYTLLLPTTHQYVHRHQERTLTKFF